MTTRKSQQGRRRLPHLDLGEQNLSPPSLSLSVSLRRPGVLVGLGGINGGWGCVVIGGGEGLEVVGARLGGGGEGETAAARSGWRPRRRRDSARVGRRARESRGVVHVAVEEVGVSVASGADGGDVGVEEEMRGGGRSGGGGGGGGGCGGAEVVDGGADCGGGAGGGRGREGVWWVCQLGWMRRGSSRRFTDSVPSQDPFCSVHYPRSERQSRGEVIEAKRKIEEMRRASDKEDKGEGRERNRRDDKG
ncbi:hypothetical protein Syun_001391 [Stephania yunnanensis]|uniref:Uncharacterized protein n=1 Tax=Stephania yunnanensis TaxID=152371 RepID=A0AAP0LDU6_9MAGN